MSEPAQLTLWGTCHGLPPNPAVVARRQRWKAQFTRAPWVAPWDTAGGLKAGQSVPGWRCPVCGEVEPNEFLLNMQHGWDPSVPGRRPWHGYCHLAVVSIPRCPGDPDWSLDWEAGDE